LLHSFIFTPFKFINPTRSTYFTAGRIYPTTH
jgi:hypothetical protein